MKHRKRCRLRPLGPGWWITRVGAGTIAIMGTYAGIVLMVFKLA